MYISIYIYAKYDMDIYSLIENGYPVGHIIKDALIGFANGNPVKFYLDEPLFFDMNKSKKGSRVGVIIPEIEANTIAMLKAVKHGFMSNFCKAIFRTSIVHQNIGCYFEKNIFSEQQIMDMLSMNQVYNLNDIKNLRFISKYPKKAVGYTPLANKPKQYPFVSSVQQDSASNQPTVQKNNSFSNPFSEIQGRLDAGIDTSTPSISSAKQKALDFQKRTLAPSLQAGMPNEYSEQTTQIQKNEYNINEPSSQVQQNEYNTTISQKQEVVEPSAIPSSVINPLPNEENVLQSETQSNTLSAQPVAQQPEQKPVTSVPTNDIDDDEDEYITNIDNSKPITAATGNDSLFDLF